MTSAVRLRDIGSTYGGLTGKTKADFGRGDASFVTFLEVINSTRLRGRALEQVRVSKGDIAATPGPPSSATGVVTVTSVGPDSAAMIVTKAGRWTDG